MEIATTHRVLAAIEALDIPHLYKVAMKNGVIQAHGMHAMEADVKQWTPGRQSAIGDICALLDSAPFVAILRLAKEEYTMSILYDNLPASVKLYPSATIMDSLLRICKQPEVHYRLVVIHGDEDMLDPPYYGIVVWPTGNIPQTLPAGTEIYIF